MYKRQDVAESYPATFIMPLLLLLITLNSAACTPSNILPTKEPYTFPTISENPTPTIPVATSLPETSSPTTTTTIDCLASGGEIENSHFESELLGTTFEFMVYIPPCYHINPQQDYPVVYLLHGLSYTNEQWLRIGLVDNMDSMIAKGSIIPFIIILPNETTSEPPQISQFPDVISQELIPWVDAHYKTIPDKLHRAIGGVSRGASWAVQIGFEHRQLFSAIGAHSLPLFQAYNGSINLWLSQELIEDQPRVFIDIGRNDQEWETAQTFANLLDANHIPHEWYMFKNGHTESYWSSHLEHYLRWYAQDW
ncbi:MAG: alpha/beta hydrolase-fold protein [Chloroflexota bacterium]|nr:alpha/beta hydrolase-fold protein [Chloroflexota bacterium]